MNIKCRHFIIVSMDVRLMNLTNIQPKFGRVECRQVSPQSGSYFSLASDSSDEYAVRNEIEVFRSSLSCRIRSRLLSEVPSCSFGSYIQHDTRFLNCGCCHPFVPIVVIFALLKVFVVRITLLEALYVEEVVVPFVWHRIDVRHVSH